MRVRYCGASCLLAPDRKKPQTGRLNKSPHTVYAIVNRHRKSGLSNRLSMNFNEEIKIEAGKLLTRRWFFKECGIGLGSLALASLLNEKSSAQSAITNPLAPKPP